MHANSRGHYDGAYQHLFTVKLPQSYDDEYANCKIKVDPATGLKSKTRSRSGFCIHAKWCVVNLSGPGKPLLPHNFSSSQPAFLQYYPARSYSGIAGICRRCRS